MRLLVIKRGAQGVGLRDTEGKGLEPGRHACRPLIRTYREPVPGACFTEEGPKHQFSQLGEKVRSFSEWCTFIYFSTFM